MDASTKVALFDAANRTWSEICVPTPRPGSEEILVRVLGCTVCGSDLHSVSGRRTIPSPSILGHEIVGEIIDFGPDANRNGIDGQSLDVGDRVVWSVVASCGDCFFCASGLPQKCVQSIKYGHVRFDSPRQLLGGFAQHCLLVKGTHTMKLPVDLPLEIACPISCVTATAAAALDQCQGVYGDNALVLGAGLLGLVICRMLRNQGIANVVCMELSPARRDKALAFGATSSLSSLDIEMTNELTDGRGFDRVFECTGRNEAFEVGFMHSRIGARILLLGSVFPVSPTPIVLERIVRRNLTLVGIHNYAPKHLQQAIEFSMSEQMRLLSHHVVDEWFPLNRLDEAFEAAHTGNALRIGVRPN